MRRLLFYLIALCMCVSASQPLSAATWRESKVNTRFQVFVPPNNEVSGRYSAIVITALQGDPFNPTQVSLIDDDADGDSDDSVLDVSLVKGQSLVRYIKDGAINDDFSGKWDGDYMRVESSLPVAVYLVTDSDWQHDWAPADDGTMRGRRFFLFANKTSVTARDINVFGYEPQTSVSVYDVTQSPLTGSGVTTINAQRGEPVLSVVLGQGEDLNIMRGQGYDVLEAGRTYEVIADKPVTVLYGALGSLVATSGARDGGGFVPGAAGSAVDDMFYFSIPHKPGVGGEQELRVVSFDDGVEVVLSGWSVQLKSYVELRRVTLNRLEHLDYVGNASHALYKLTATGGKIAAFEANWLETGSPGTSDVMSFAAGDFDASGAQEFLVYVGPPGNQGNTSISTQALSHLYIFSDRSGAQVRVTDADTGGMRYDRSYVIGAQGYVDATIDLTTYNALNQPTQGIRPYFKIDASSPVAVCMANWNDNWMAYATSVLVRNPQLVIEAPAEANLGSRQRLNVTLSNWGDVPLDDVVVTVMVPGTLSVVSSALSGAGAPSVSVSARGYELSFLLGRVAVGQVISGWIDVDVSSGRGGELVVIEGSARGVEAGQSVASLASGVLKLVDDAIGRVEGLSTQGDDHVINLMWSLDTTGVQEATTQVITRATSAQGPYTTLATLVGVAGGQGLVPLSYADLNVQNGQIYYYRIETSTALGAQGAWGPVAGLAKDVTAPLRVSMTGQLEGSGARLDWSVSESEDLVGYRIERSLNGSSWVTLVTTLSTELTYLDAGLTAEVDYYYRVRALDDDGLLSAPSNVVALRPTAALWRDVLVCFEDMIGAGANDWDYNDVIVRVGSRLTVNGGMIERIEVDIDGMARGAGYVHQLRVRLPLRGSWQITRQELDAGSSLLRSSAQWSGQGEADVPLTVDTRQLLPPLVGSYTNTSPDQGRFIPGRRVRLIIEMTGALETTPAQLGQAPWDMYLKLPYLPEPNEVHDLIYGGFSEPVTQDVALAGQLLGFVRVLEFGAEPVSPQWPAWAYEGVPVWKVYPQFEGFILSGQALDPQWFLSPVEGLYFSALRD